MKGHTKKRCRTSSKLEVRAKRRLRRMRAEVAKQRAQLIRMREEVAEAEAAANEMAAVIAGMRRENHLIMLVQDVIQGLEAEDNLDGQAQHNPPPENRENTRRK